MWIIEWGYYRSNLIQLNEIFFTSMQMCQQLQLCGIQSHNQTWEGFWENSSALDAIFVVRQIVQKALDFNKKALMCFIYFTQVFDRSILLDVPTLLKKK